MYREFENSACASRTFIGLSADCIDIQDKQRKIMLDTYDRCYKKPTPALAAWDPRGDGPGKGAIVSGGARASASAYVLAAAATAAGIAALVAGW